MPSWKETRFRKITDQFECFDGLFYQKKTTEIQEVDAQKLLYFITRVKWDLILNEIARGV